MNLPNPSELHLWHLDADASHWIDYIEFFAGLLNEEELHRMHSFNFEQLRSTFMITRAFCRLVLSRYLPQIKPQCWRFENNPYGRPRVIAPQNSCKIDFNISHSKGIIVMAVAAKNRSIGVDIEMVTPTPAQPEIAAQFFSSTEKTSIYQLPTAQQTDRFFELWTTKESYIKARGKGLSIPLNSFSITICRDSRAPTPLQARLTSTAPDDNPGLWHIMLSDFPPYFKLALCARVNHPQETLTLKYFNFEMRENTQN
ncbi:MAG: 4'-phosphopantetheinyl transferase superfamily protein [Ketobacter sp.]|nr:4'-phosphopantetheinyl transferase superfamily protein [Ketobacter sp.]